MAVYASFSYAGNFLTSVREVTAQFELQRVSLGAILQDQNKANQLFSEIKSFALKSPIKILDLTKYTKQLAAYKIGVNELFDTTKRLADISVGIGVSMDRLILLYGQVRATGYLRGCLGKGTSVKMFDGSNKKVEDVIVGDAIMGDDGQKRNVLSLVRNRETMYIVKYDGGSFRCNENHILTLYNINSDSVEDVYVLDYLKCSALYKGVKCTNGEYEYFDMSVERDCEDDYFGFEIDGNKRFIIEGNIVTHNSEVRQATEAGIPLVEELANKLSEANGTLVTSAQVLKMVEERAISFEMVKEVFEDMTNAGGLFYDMQEKQGNTLYGMWAKLGDAASVMYDEIGNTGAVNGGMKLAIQTLTDLMRNWKATADTIVTVGGTFALTFAAMKRGEKIYSDASVAAKAKRIAAQRELNIVTKTGTEADIAAAQAALDKANADEKAAVAAEKNVKLRTKLGKGLLSLGTSLLKGLGIGLVVGLLTEATFKLFEWIHSIGRLKGEIEEIREETDTLTGQSVRNFEYLADAAVNAADGSKKQKDALDELQRTYRDIIPVEDLKIERLRAMKGNYEALTTAIGQYIAQQQKAKEIEAVDNEYGADIAKYTRKLRDRLKKAGLGLSEISRIIKEFQRLASEGAFKGYDHYGSEAINAALRESGFTAKQIDKIWRKLNYGDIKDLYDLTRNYANDLKDINAYYDTQLGAMGRFAKIYEAISKRVAATRFTLNGENVDTDSFLYGQMNMNVWVKNYARAIREAFKVAGADISKIDFAEIMGVNADGTGMSSIDFSKVFGLFDREDVKQILGKNRETLLSFVKQIQQDYLGMLPDDAVMNTFNDRFVELANAMGPGFIDKVKNSMMKTGESMQDFRKRIADEVKAAAEDVATYTAALNALYVGMADYADRYDEIKTELDAAKQMEKFKQALLDILPAYQSNSGGQTSDPRLGILQEMVSTLKQVNKEYDDLAKKEGVTKALAHTQEKYAATFKYLQSLAKYLQSLAAKYKFDLPDFGVPTTPAALTKYLDAVKKAMAHLPKSEKAVLSLETDIADINMAAAQRKIEDQLKILADRISQTKAARDFYDNILGLTGSREVAQTLSLNIYGGDGTRLKEQIARQVREIVDSTSATLDEGVFNPDKSINAKALRKWIKDNLEAIGGISGEAYKQLTALAAESEASIAKSVEGWLKAIEHSKSYGEKLTDIYRRTAVQIAQIRQQMDNGLDRGVGNNLIEGLQRKQAEEIAALQYEAFKGTPLYVQMFDDLDHASTRMLQNMRSNLIAMQGQWQNLSPTQLKELQARLKEIDTQLTRRNPFKTLAASMREYFNLRRKGDGRGNRSRDAADMDLQRATEAYQRAQEELAETVNNPDATEAQIAGAQRLVELTKREKEEAEATAARWKKVEDAIGLSVREMSQMFNWAGDLAGAIADMTDALGGDEEDVQFWNDLSDGLDDVFSGVQDFINAAMSLNITGMVSSVLTSVPKMITGFTKIFQAGKIRRANKEIKRQQEILEQLEYSYGRLEAASDSLFGTDYLRNYNDRLRVLQAQQQAYEKQARAERSKGKDADKEKIKEYENQARETADKIKELQDDLAAQIVGTSVADAARDFANAWLEAYLSFGSTTDAISEKFNDMIKNMVVNQALAAVVQRSLAPIFKMIDDLADDGELSASDIASVMAQVPQAIEAIDGGLRVGMEGLKAAGVDLERLRGASGEFSGIAKSVAGATSEEINAVAAVGNTLLHYASPIPRIDENVARIVVAMESRSAYAPTSAAAAGWTDWQQQAMDNYQAIARNTAETVVRCERAAIACEKMARVIKTKGSTSGFNVFLNS